MSSVEPRATSPDIRSAYKLVVAYLAKHAARLGPDQIEAGDELKRRIKRMENEAGRLVKINNVLLDAETPKFSFDESTDTITMTHKGLSHSVKIKRERPDVPVKIAGATAMGAYKAGATHADDEHEQSEELKLLMEQMLEHYYNNAFRITKLLQVITGKMKYHCPEITLVRNKLIEHPERGSIYSFGFSSNGPVVKPLYRGARDWHDPGLVPNSVALVESMKKVLVNDA